MRPLSVMVTEVQGLTRTGNTTTTKNALNRVYRQLAQLAEWPSLRAEDTFTTSADGVLVLPLYVGEVKEIYDSTNTRWILPVSQINRRFQTTATTTGSAYHWEFAGWQPVLTQPSAADQIQLIADDESTTPNVTVSLTGLVSPTITGASGYVRRTEVLDLTGETEAMTTASFVEILSLSKSGDSAVDIAVRDTPGGTATVLGMIPIEVYSPRYLKIQLHYRPGSGTSLNVTYQRIPDRLINDTDAPLLPCSDYLVYAASAEIEQSQKLTQRALAMQQKAAMALDELRRRELGHARVQQTIPHPDYARDYE